jgi:hypothetical protein
MKKQHADKMADLCHREEEAKKQVATWEQMYREWMATMERRVNNLQVTNEELQVNRLFKMIIRLNIDFRHGCMMITK